MPSQAMQDAIGVIRDRPQASADPGPAHVYQLLRGTPEAAEATERIGKFLWARVPSPDSSERHSSHAS